MKKITKIIEKNGLFLSLLLITGLFCSLYIFSVINVSAKPGKNNQSTKKITPVELEKEIKGSFDYDIDDNTGKITFLKAINNQGITLAEYPAENPTPASVATQFVAEYGSYFGLEKPLEESSLVKDRKDDKDTTHFWYNQKYKGIPVFAGQMAVHVDNNLQVKSANGKVISDINLDTNPKISREKAIKHALNLWKKQFDINEAKILNSELIIFNKGIIENKADNKNYLVYEIELYKEPSVHEFYYINAYNSDLVYQVTGTYNINRRIPDCSIYPFVAGCGLDTSYGGSIHGRSEGKPARGVNPLASYGLTDVDDLYTIMNQTHNYFADKFGRNGANEQGGLGDGVYSAVTNSDGWTYLDSYPGVDCPNAFFDGFSINFCDGVVDTDVAAHEYGHGVVHYSIPGGLTYTYESGALHEAFADIFGAEVENYVTGSGNWQMGENLNVPGLSSPIRSLSNPSSVSDGLGPHPDRFYSNFTYCGTTDNGGVHHNSTIISHAAYLMAEGGTSNTCTISAIGRSKMEKIFYQALTNYFTTNIDFNGAFNALNTACADLYGASSTTCLEASQALMSVEINQEGRCSSESRVIPGCGDSTSPTISGRSPAEGSDSGARNTNISFEINDNNAGVNPASIAITINGDDVIADGNFQSGYSVTMTPNDNNGYSADINPTEIFDNNERVTVAVEAADNNNNSMSDSWSFTITDLPKDPKILTTSGPGEVTRLQAYDRKGNAIGSEKKDIFPDSYLGGAGIIPLDANNNGIRDQIVVFASSNGGPQARTLGLKENGDMTFFGQMFVFDSSIRDGLSMASGDFDGDGYVDDVAACLTGDRSPNVKVYKDATGVDNWELIGDFTAPFGNVGCNVGTFQYDSGPPEIIVSPHHGPADPYVYIYTVGGTLKEYFAAYGAGVTNGLTPSGIEDRIYTTPNNGSSQINAFDREGTRKNFWWAYQEHVRGDFKNVPGDIDLDGKDEVLISPIGSNGPQVLAFEPTGKWRVWPNFFAFGDETLRNGVGIAVIDNFHGAN